jgi:hypothetical protein
MGGPNQFTNPVTDEDRQAIRDLHARGLGRNEIARQLKRGGRTISVEAAAMGLTFDRAEMTEVATRNRAADLAERRTILAEALTDDALRLSAQMWEPAVVYAFGGKEGDYKQKAVDQPPADAKRALMLAAGQAIQRSLQLVPPVNGGGEDEARSMVGRLMSGLAEIYREQTETEQAEAAGDEGAGDAP